MKRIKIEDVVYNYPTKYKIGFTNEEIRELLKKFPQITFEKFSEAIGIHTAALIEGQVVMYHTDVALGIICAMENRSPSLAEFD